MTQNANSAELAEVVVKDDNGRPLSVRPSRLSILMKPDGIGYVELKHEGLTMRFESVSPYFAHNVRAAMLWLGGTLAPIMEGADADA